MVHWALVRRGLLEWWQEKKLLVIKVNRFRVADSTVALGSGHCGPVQRLLEEFEALGPEKGTTITAFILSHIGSRQQSNDTRAENEMAVS